MVDTVDNSIINITNIFKKPTINKNQEFGDLRIRVFIEGAKANLSRKFNVRIKLNSSTEKGPYYVIMPDGTISTVTFKDDGWSKETFALSDKDTILIKNIPFWYTLSAKEEDYGSYTVSTKMYYTQNGQFHNGDGSETEYKPGNESSEVYSSDSLMSNIDFKNVRDKATGDVKISMKVDGNDSSPNESFVVNMFLYQNNGTKNIAHQGTYTTINQDGTEGEITFDNNGNGNVSLKNGEYIIIKNLPTNYVLKISETDTKSYTLKIYNEAGEFAGKYADVNIVSAIVPDADNHTQPYDVKLWNHKDLSKNQEPHDLKILMHTEGSGADKNKKFNVYFKAYNNTYNGTYKVIYDDGTISSITIGNNGYATTPIKLSDGEYALIKHLPAGKYVQVKNVPENYISYVQRNPKNKNGSDYTAGENDNNYVQMDETWPMYNSDIYLMNINIKNVLNVGNVKISMTTEGNVADVNQQFDVLLHLTDSNGSVKTGNYKYTDTDGNKKTITFNSSGDATISMKHGQSIILENLPTNYKLTVSEPDNHGYTVTTKNNSDTYSSNTSVIATVPDKSNGPDPYEIGIKNYIHQNMGDVKIVMKTDGDIADKNLPFVINLFYYQYNGTANIGKTGTFTYTDENGGSHSITFDSTGHAKVSMHDGQYIILKDLYSGYGLLTQEIDTQGYIVNVTHNSTKLAENVKDVWITIPNKEDSSGINPDVVTYINTLNQKRGNLKISMNVSGNMGNRNKPFNVHLLAKDWANNGKMISGDFSYTKSDGTTGILTFDANGNANIILFNKESVTINGLPAGITVYVNEGFNYSEDISVYDGYDVSVVNDYTVGESGTYCGKPQIVADTTANITFTNTLNAEVPTGIDISFMTGISIIFIGLVGLIAIFRHKR